MSFDARIPSRAVLNCTPRMNAAAIRPSASSTPKTGNDEVWFFSDIIK